MGIDYTRTKERAPFSNQQMFIFFSFAQSNTKRRGDVTRSNVQSRATKISQTYQFYSPSIDEFRQLMMIEGLIPKLPNPSYDG